MTAVWLVCDILLVTPLPFQIPPPQLPLLPPLRLAHPHPQQLLRERPPFSPPYWPVCVKQHQPTPPCLGTCTSSSLWDILQQSHLTGDWSSSRHTQPQL